MCIRDSRITYTAQVAETFSNGLQVINGSDEEPLINVAKSHFNRDEERGGFASGDVVTGWGAGLIDPFADRDRRSPRATATFDVVGPIIDFNKSANVGGTNTTVSGLPHGILGEISLVDVGDTITYTVEVNNTGDGTAFDVVATDNLGDGDLTFVPNSVVAPAGTTCSLSGNSPETLDCVIDEISPAGSVTITYEATAPTSPDLTSNPMLFENTVEVVEFFESDGGVGPRFITGEATLTNLVYAPSPLVSVGYAGEGVCLAGTNPGDTVPLVVGIRHNSFDPSINAASLDGIATGYNPTLTVIIPASMSVDETTITANGPLLGDAGFTVFNAFVPDSATVNPDGTTTLEWTTLPDVPYSTAEQIRINIDTTVTDPGGSPFPTGTLVYEDELGNISRGGNVAAFAEYESFSSPRCGGGGGGGGPREGEHGVSKTPDVVDSVNLLSGTRGEFTISVINNRSEDLTNVEVVDTLPQDILYLGADDTAIDYEVATISPLLPGDLVLEDFYVDTVTNPDGTSTVTWSGLPDLPRGTWTITFPVSTPNTIGDPETFQDNTFRINSDQGPRTDIGLSLIHISEPTRPY